MELTLLMWLSNFHVTLAGNTKYNDPGTKTVLIQGTAKYKPGGSEMILNLLVKGENGLMSATNQPAKPDITPSTPPPSAASSTPSPTTSIPRQSSNSEDFKDYEVQGLNLHNKFRKVHGSQMMTLSKKLCEEAQAYAEKIAAAGNLIHASKDERRGQGENLSMGCSSNSAQTVTEAVTNWYNEVCNPGYTFNGGGFQGGTGHFTQVVWNDSVKFGIGRAESTRNGMKCAYIVGRYSPPGNFDQGRDDYNTNVKQGSFDSASYCATVNAGFRDQMFQRFKKPLSKILKRSFHSKHH